jgi:hypothetical protein
MMKIEILIKGVYGVTKYYPVCSTGKLFAEIANTTTLTEAVLKKIKALGYELEFKLPAPPAI